MFHKSLTAEKLDDVAWNLAKAAANLTEALGEIQDNDVKWQENRARTAP